MIMIIGWKMIGCQEMFDCFCVVLGLVWGWSDCYGYLLVVIGCVDVMVDLEMNIWDVVVLLLILQEVGGYFVMLDGWVVVDGGNGLSVNVEICDVVLKVIVGIE